MILFILITIFSSANLSHGFSKTSPGTSKPSPSVITSPPKTSAVLRVTYDGTLFHGWSASNDGSATNGIPKLNKRGRSRRNRNRPSVRKGEVRSVEGTLRYALSKLYGNVGVDRIIVEGCSRTDAGVSARHMIALIYCLYEDDGEEGLNRGTLAIEGKRLPHPTSPTDEGFMPLPFKGDLSKMMYALNKMLPPDVRIRDTSSTPTINGTYESGERKVPFHPSLETVTKTYSYTFSVGDLHDPIRCR
jgi:tRNA U38,U39,U40 pseudouridine synthase TruA